MVMSGDVSETVSPFVKIVFSIAEQYRLLHSFNVYATNCAMKFLKL